MAQSTPADQQFEAQRGRLFSIAYRMLGSASDAEDAVQDAYMRWRGAAEVRDPEAYLVRVVTRLCLDRLTSARTRREVYVGPWLPEPVLTGLGTDEPLATVQQRESVSFAALLLLERLSPTERAVFVLRGVFDAMVNSLTCWMSARIIVASCTTVLAPTWPGFARAAGPRRT